ncbi:RuBisCO operon transcriptional regulator CbbR, partial [hydrothermal vent metagenome]
RRSGQGFQVNDCGQEVLQLGHRIQAAIETSSQKLQALQTGKAGSIGVGVVSTGKYFAPQILAAFMREYPDIDLRVTIGNRAEITQALDSHAVDLAIMGRPPQNISAGHDYLGEHPFGIIAAGSHPLRHLQTVPAAKLLAETFLMREPGSGTRALAGRYLDQYGAGRGYASITMNANESIKQAVMAGMGIAMISLHTVIHELEQERLVCLKMPGLPLVRRWILVHPTEQPLSGAAEIFRSFLLSKRAAFLPG